MLDLGDHDLLQLAMQSDAVRATAGWRQAWQQAARQFAEKHAERRYAAVSVIEQDEKLLCVWNSRYGGWSLPGGMVEPGETLEQAQKRELLEETGLDTLRATLVFQGPHGLPAKPGRATDVAIFEVEAVGQAVARETKIDWMTRADFLRQSPFAPFYDPLFQTVLAPKPFAPGNDWDVAVWFDSQITQRWSEDDLLKIAQFFKAYQGHIAVRRRAR